MAIQEARIFLVKFKEVQPEAETETDEWKEKRRRLERREGKTPRAV